jgi:hypothetical protein
VTVATILTLTKKRTVFSKLIMLTLAPLPVRISPELCKRDAYGGRRGAGVAVCADLGLLVISSSSELQVFALPSDIARCHVQSDLAHVRTLGGFVPMKFQFYYGSGYMACTDGCGEAISRRLLLATDTGVNGRGAVHVIDVVRGTHEGYLAAPGTIACPQGVATRKSRAAVSCWNSVHVFEMIARRFC